MTGPLPHASETLVIGLPWQEVMHRMANATTQKLLTQNQVTARGIVFTGHVREDSFRISLKISRPNSFLPLVHGKIEPTSAGCILFLRYALFPITKMYLSFWVLFTIMAGIFVTHQYRNIALGITAGVVAAAILFVAWANFRIQLKFTRDALQKILA